MGSVNRFLGRTTVCLPQFDIEFQYGVLET